MGLSQHQNTVQAGAEGLRMRRSNLQAAVGQLPWLFSDLGCVLTCSCQSSCAVI